MQLFWYTLVIYFGDNFNANNKIANLDLGVYKKDKVISFKDR